MNVMSVKLLLLVLTTLSQPAFAFYDQLRIEPETPAAGQQVFFSVRAGLCDGITGGPIAPGVVLDMFRTVVRNGSDVVVTFSAYESGNDASCFIDPTVFRFRIGAFPQGQYNLILVPERSLSPGDLREVARLPFTVGQAQPIAVPSLSVPSLLLLVVLMLLVARPWCLPTIGASCHEGESHLAYMLDQPCNRSSRSSLR